MYRIIDGRGTGKTSRLLLLAKENNGVVVCKNPDQMRNHAYRYGLTGIDYISYADYLNYLNNYTGCLGGKRLDLKGRVIFIDEIDLFFKVMSSNIQGYTLSLE